MDTKDIDDAMNRWETNPPGCARGFDGVCACTEARARVRRRRVIASVVLIAVLVVAGVSYGVKTARDDDARRSADLRDTHLGLDIHPEAGR